MLRLTNRLKCLNNNNFIGLRRTALNTNHQPSINYSQSPKSDEIVVNRTSKIFFGVLFTAGTLGFAWYVKREKELG